MSEERHPLVQNMIDICEQAVKDNDPINKLMKDLGLDNSTHEMPQSSVKRVQLAPDELIKFLRTIGVPEKDIQEILKGPEE